MKKIFSSLMAKYIAIFVGILLITNMISIVVMLLLSGELFIEHTFESLHITPRIVLFRTGIMSVVLGTVFILIATRIVVKPIKELSNATKKVAEGELDVKFNYRFRGHDEVCELAENFEYMVQALAKNEYLHKDFVANVSHEFKTPITAIQGYAEMLASPYLTDEKRIEYSSIIMAQSGRLAKLSTNLLRLSELESGNHVMQIEKFSLDEQIRDAVLLLQNEWESKSIVVELMLDEITIQGDKALLYQVWINLLGNGIKYGKQEGVLRVRATRKEKVTIIVSDDGAGLSEKQCEKIFDRFYTADESRNKGGTGLGLPITKRIVELHGGTIQVQSQQGIGSDFIVELP